MKKYNRFLSFLLALALVITTFGSDLASTKVYALSSEEVMEEAAVPSVVFESTDNEAAEDNDNDADLPNEEPETTVTEEGAVVADENAAGEGDNAPAVENAEAEGDTAADAEEKKEEEVTPEAEGEAVEDPEAAEDAEEVEEEEEVEDVEEEDAEIKDTEKKVVEKEFKEAVEIDGIKISLYAEPGVLPADAVLKVEKVEAEDEDQIQELIDDQLGEDISVEKTYSYDINIVSSETGEKYNPENDDTVEVVFSQVEEAASDQFAMEVYHVNDELTEAESVSDVVADGTAISFDAEHFSIYTVTVYKKNYSAYSTTMTVKFVDVNLKEVGAGKSSISLPVDSYNTSISAEDILKGMTIPSGYQFVSFAYEINRSKDIITDFRLVEGYSTYYYHFDDKVQYKTASSNNWTDLSNNTVYAVLRSDNQKTTSKHLDLGFEATDFAKYYNGAKVYAVVNGKEHEMYVDAQVYHENFDGKDYYEFRYSSKDPISVKDTIEFRVVYGGKTYSMKCSEEKNIEAFERCFRSHYKIQKEYGFDYLCVFSQEFNLTGDVRYHKNDGTSNLKTVDLNWTSTNPDEKQQHTVLTYEQTKLGAYADHTFVGWSTDPEDSIDEKTGKLHHEVVAGSKIEVKNKDDIDIYAIWKSNAVATYKVAVYATDGTKSATVNPQLKQLLGLNYIQSDSYYPVGIVELPATLFKGRSPYIRTDDDWKLVAQALSNTSLDTSAAALEPSHGANGNNIGNTVGSNLQYVQVDYNGTAGSYKTAMFDWNRDEYDGSIKVPAGQHNFAYHLDLRFDTEVVNYYGVYFDEGVISAVTRDPMYQQAFLEGTDIEVTSYDNTPAESEGYHRIGYYTDRNCTTEVEPGDDLGKVRTVYVRYENYYYVKYEDGLGGSQFTTQTTENLSYGDPTPAFNAGTDNEKLKRDGYTFEGWDPAVSTTVKNNATYVAQWKMIPYTITYTDGVEDEEVFKDQITNNCEYGTATPAFVGGKDGKPVRDRYEFTGWVNSKGGSWYTPVSGDETYTATWKALYADYTVNWYLRGATAPTKIQDSVTRSDVKIGEKAYATADDKDVSKLGNKFIGLEYDTTSVDNVVVDENGTAQINLYFKKSKYTVKYEYRDADDIANKSPLPNGGEAIDQIFDDTVNCAPDATARGYDFDGWKFADNYGSYVKDKRVPDTFSMPASNVVLYGTFSPSEDTAYYVEHWLENSTGGYDQYGNSELNTGKTGELAAYEEYSFDNYKYVGAYVGDKKPENAATEQNTKIKADGTLTIRLYYDRKSYKVHYSYYGDYPKEAEDQIPQDDSYKFGTVVEVAPKPYVQGYVFKGWDGTYELEDLMVREAPDRGLRGLLGRIYEIITRKVSKEGEPEKYVFDMPAANVNMLGCFEPDFAEYKVNYWLQNATLDGYDVQTADAVTVTERKTNDQAVYELKDYGTAYSYFRTEVGGKVVTDDTTIKVLPDGSLVIDVYYNRVFKNVTYEYTGTVPEGANELLPNAGKPFSYWVGTEQKVEDAVVLDAYDFSGWTATTADQSVLQIDENGKYNMPATDVVFTGEFKIKKFTVTYKFKDTEGNDATPKKFEEIKYGEFAPTYSVTDSQIPEGTYFDGWLDEDGNLLQVNDIAKVVVKKNREFTAQYRMPHKTTISVVAETDGGDVDTTLPYNGGKQFADIKLKIDVQVEVNDAVITSTEDSIFGTLSSLIGKVLSLGAITADAENGEATLAEDVTIKVDGEDVTYRVEVDVVAGQGKDVNIEGYPTKVTDIRVTADGEDASEQFDINLKKGDTVGHLYITPATLTVKTYGKSKVYDKKPLVNEKIEVTGFQRDEETGEMETATYAATGSITQVGKARNTYTLVFDKTAKESNYDVKENLGWLIVNPDDNQEETPHDPTEEPETPAAPGQVLGAQRPEGAVLGARRGGTEDSANMVGRIITIVVAAGIGFTMIFLKRKKNEDEQ